MQNCELSDIATARISVDTIIYIHYDSSLGHHLPFYDHPV